MTRELATYLKNVYTFSMNYRTIAKDGLTQDIIKKSRFICQTKRIYSEEEGRDFIAKIKKEHYKANHSCSAMIIGEDSSIKRSSDDGEPSGTAGIPMLTVLEKNELTNIVAVVTRYFGGIKLGTGGLIRAYSSSVAHHLNEIGLVTIKEQRGVQIDLTYSQYQTFSNFLERQALKEHQTDFGTRVTSTVFADPEKLALILQELEDFYQGKITYQLTESQLVEVPVN